MTVAIKKLLKYEYFQPSFFSPANKILFFSMWLLPLPYPPNREAETVPEILCCGSLAIVKGQNWQNSGKEGLHQKRYISDFKKRRY